ncbi:MAG: hypothetical protein J1F40_09580 [Prevotellaceae bacterium]|nr:hypothetical protein [Prevotellaceae bacterium]
MEQNTKRCPYCGEEILSVAKKCKHCGEWLEKENGVEKVAPFSQSKQEVVATEASVEEAPKPRRKWLNVLKNVAIGICCLVTLLVVIGLFLPDDSDEDIDDETEYVVNDISDPEIDKELDELEDSFEELCNDVNELGWGPGVAKEVNYFEGLRENFIDNRRYQMTPAQLQRIKAISSRTKHLYSELDIDGVFEGFEELE